MIIAQHMEPAVEPAAAGARAVAITDATVIPNTLVVPPLTRVTWRNSGHNRHTSTADAGQWNSGPLFPGHEFTITAPATPGVYAYHCIYHSFIRGTLTVSLVALQTPAPVHAGEGAMLEGTVPGADDGTPVTIERRVPGAWATVASVTTDATGAFAADSPPLTTRTAFRALTGASISPAIRVEVRPHLSARRTGRRVRVTVMPARRGTPVMLERLDLDSYRWEPVSDARLGATGHTRFLLRGAGVYRVAVSAAGGLDATASAPIQFRPGRFHQ
jgi:plastocyanin